jgi:hypothetical protein
MSDDQHGRHRGQFPGGQSGNPAGRPKGSRNKVTAICTELLGDAAEDVIAKLIEQAKAGDGIALRLCVERLVPVHAARDRAVQIDLPDASQRAEDLVLAAATIIDQAAQGKITLSEAREFMTLLESERKLVETADLAVRIDALESDRRRTETKRIVEREIRNLPTGQQPRVRVLDPAAPQPAPPAKPARAPDPEAARKEEARMAINRRNRLSRK